MKISNLSVIGVSQDTLHMHSLRIDIDDKILSIVVKSDETSESTFERK